jgi:hypothetical protein
MFASNSKGLQFESVSHQKFEERLVKWFGSAVVASLSEYHIAVFTRGND